MPRALQDQINDTLTGENYEEVHLPRGGGYRSPGSAIQGNPFQPTPSTFDPRLSDAVWANTPEGLAESNRQNDYNQGLQQQQTAAANDPWGGIQQGNYRGFFERLFPGESLTPQQLQAQEAALGRIGIKLRPNAAGRHGKIQLPDGSIIDVIQGADSGLNRRQWLTGDGGQAAGGGDRQLLDQFVQSLLDKEKANQARATELAGTFRSRAEELKAPPYSAGDEASMRAKMFDQFERRRQETLKNDRESVYARGFAPTSGLVRDVEDKTNDRFEQARTGMESTLVNQMIDEGQRRKDRAVELETLAQQALAGGDATSLQYQANAADLEDNLIRDAYSRSRDDIGDAFLTENAGNERLRAIMSMLSGSQGGGSNDIFSSILGMGQFGQQSRALDNQVRGQNMQGLGALASLIAGVLDFGGDN